MWVFTEIADWFEDKRKESDLILDNWVDDTDYNHGAIIMAAQLKLLQHLVLVL